MSPLEPRPLRMWGLEADLPPESLESVLATLGAARVYWLTTALPGRPPHPRPMWGLLHEGQLLLSAPSTQMTHVTQAPLVAVHIDDGETVVIVEGRAAAGDESTIANFVRLYEAKYDYALPPRVPLVVRPSEVLTWTIRGEAARDGFSRGGRWVSTDP